MSLPADTHTAIAKAGAAAAKESEVWLDSADGVPDMIQRVVPDGYRVDTTDLTKYRAHPVRRAGHPVFHEPASFGAYVLSQKTTGTTLYADVTGGRGGAQMTAIIDGHEPTDGAPGWGEHRASLALRETPSWIRWMRKNGEEQSPEAFAEFLEDNARDIVEPDAASLIELARTLEVHKDVNYVNITRPATGARKLHYDETVTAKGGDKGDIVIPDVLSLALAPWEGVDRFGVTAKFRFRLSGGSLALSFVLVRPEAVLEAAFVGMPDADPPVPGVLTVVQDLTGLTALHGRP